MLMSGMSAMGSQEVGHRITRLRSSDNYCCKLDMSIFLHFNRYIYMTEKSHIYLQRDERF